MEHIAIMRKSWGLTQKILTGQKRIESRWYKSRYAPWGKINAGETIYFKDSGEPVSIKAEVNRVMQFQGLNPKKVKEILGKYGKKDGLDKEQIPEFFRMFRDKRYCMLIFLKKPRKVEPFGIDKKGFGSMAAWICVEDINNLRKIL